MSVVKPQKLKKLLQLNREIPLTTQKLKNMGVNNTLIQRYKESNWIESIGRGAYKFPEAELSFEGMMHSLQTDLSLHVYPGAKTALEMAGIRQYYREKEKIYLFIDSKTNLPLWAGNYRYERELRVIKSSKWDDKEFLVNPNTKGFEFFIASKELAIVQQIELVGKGESFEETAQLFELLDSMDPDLLKKILKNASKRSRRIFKFFSDFYRHPWNKHISKKVLDSGNSVITIEKGGKYLSQYKLVIPEGFNV
ncbi:MAG: type IV toxin-antitoxin system AbiEi family antitoxin domain-containing protein [Acidobacteriota bacterium]